MSLQRFDIVNGVAEAEGAAKESAAGQEEDKDAAGNAIPSFDLLILCALFKLLVLSILFAFVEKGVPDFWLTAMKNNEVLAEEVCVFCYLLFLCV